MLLDANGLIYRAYFALYNTPLTTSHGELVNAVFGFWSIVLRGFQDVRPDYVIACFDLAGPTFRHEAFAEYKATRRKMPDDLRDQFPKVRELIEAFRIPIHQLEGWEADDLIGTLARQAEADGLDTTIVSGDLDMLQLVSERTSVMTTRGGVQQTVVYDPSAVFERYGLTPDQMIDFKALKGDTTDNIPGIPGVGDKTAAKLLLDFGSLDAVYADPERVTPEKLRLKVIEHRDQVMINRQLVTIHRDLPVELDLSTARLGDYDRAEVIRLFREYEFRSLVERLPGVDGEAALAPGELLRQEDGTSPIPAAIVPGRVLASRPRGGLSGEGSGLQLTLDFAALSDGSSAVATAEAIAPALADEPPAVPGDEGGSAPRITALPASAGPADRLRALLRDPGLAEPFGPGDDPSAWLAAQPTLAVGLALDDPRPRRGTLLGLAVGGADGRLLAAGPDDAERLLTAIASVRAPLAGHDVKRVLVAELARRDPAGTAGPVHRGAALPPIGFDTQIAAYILNAALRSQTLTDICAERLDVELPPAGTLGGRDHAALEAAAVAAARASLEPALHEADLDQLYGELELPLVPVLAGMEATGVALDRAALDALRVEFGDEIGAARVGHLRGRRPRVQPGQSQAARAGPLLRARPASRQADQDGLLDRRLGPRGAAARPPDDPDAPRLAGVHEAQEHLHRRPAAAPRPAYRPPAHDLPPGRGRDRAAQLVRPEPPEHPHPERPRAAHPPGLRGRRARAPPCWPPTTARSSCASWPTSRATRRSRTPSPARPTSTARPPPWCSTRTPPT